jgi:hypothetical protein
MEYPLAILPLRGKINGETDIACADTVTFRGTKEECSMSESNKKDWRELCASVASESDPKKLGLLVEELIRALEERQSQLYVATHQPTDTNRPSAIK